MQSEQAAIQDFAPETETVDVTRTIRLNLESSEAKNRIVRRAIDDWQAVAAYTADVLPSFPFYRWGSRDTQLKRVVKDYCDDLDIYAHDRDAAIEKAREAFSSWHERGQEGSPPKGEFGDADYFRMSTSSSSKSRREIVSNDRGYGLRADLLKDEEEVWWHINAGEYQEDFIEKVVDGPASLGVVEFHLADDGGLFAHVSITEPVERYVAEDVSTTVGVDLGEAILYAAAAVDGSGEVCAVEMESGSKFRHHRNELSRKYEDAQHRGDRIKARRDRERYTDHVTNRASKRIVELATAHAPSRIQIEDLTGMREGLRKRGDDPIHDWPYHKLTEQIKYKATAAGIPWEEVAAGGTSTTCRKCGHRSEENRPDRSQFRCEACGYEVHADVNAAINIAGR